MFLCESILLAEIVFLGIYVTRTDIKYGIIENKALLSAIIPGIIVNVLYFTMYAVDFLTIYILNLIVISVFAIALYGFHFWGAGDSKLLICVNMLFPARLYDQNILSIAPGLNAVIIIFLLSYIFVFVESFILLLKKTPFYKEHIMSLETVKKFALNYLICFLYLRGVNGVLRNLFQETYIYNIIPLSFLSIFLAVIVYNHKFFRKWYMILIMITTNLFVTNIFVFNSVYFYSYLILLAVLMFRYILNGYNYKEITTEEVKQGIVLAYPTVLWMVPSRIHNLPKTTTEDVRSRLSAEQAEAIKKWGRSKYGRQRILIVRLIPFAIFICIGELVYFFVRILL